MSAATGAITWCVQEAGRVHAAARVVDWEGRRRAWRLCSHHPDSEVDPATCAPVGAAAVGERMRRPDACPVCAFEWKEGTRAPRRAGLIAVGGPHAPWHAARIIDRFPCEVGPFWRVRLAAECGWATWTDAARAAVLPDWNGPLRGDRCPMCASNHPDHNGQEILL